MRLIDNFEKLPGVYIIKNLINGKYYIGESLNIKNRISQHCKGTSQIFHKAIKKYGINNFEVYVEYLQDFNKSDLIELEECLIIKYNSVSPKGYNICLKGSDCTGVQQSTESKLKKSKS
jgi:group I intron endonuclease